LLKFEFKRSDPLKELEDKIQSLTRSGENPHSIMLGVVRLLKERNTQLEKENERLRTALLEERDACRLYRNRDLTNKLQTQTDPSSEETSSRYSERTLRDTEQK
jgi:hypothetical protein